ncbi:MAG TPA: hypothetical protein VHX44_14695 [Planctomycetota bacterium]|jgi:hypothetical protein|nr:hypothetical protein [Planctomycetota bacterium]
MTLPRIIQCLFLSCLSVSAFCQEASAASFVKTMRSEVNAAAGITTTWKLLNTNPEKSITVTYGWSDKENSASPKSIELQAGATVPVETDAKHGTAYPRIKSATFSAK